MSPETVKAIGDALKPLAEKIGQGGAHVYEVFTRQQYVLGIGFFIWGGLALILAVAAAGVAITHFRRWSKLKAEKAGWSETETPGMITVIALTATMFGLIVAVGFISSGTMHLLNPEYYAIQDILCTVKDCTP